MNKLFVEEKQASDRFTYTHGHARKVSAEIYIERYVVKWRRVMQAGRSVCSGRSRRQAKNRSFLVVTARF